MTDRMNCHPDHDQTFEMSAYPINHLSMADAVKRLFTVAAAVVVATASGVAIGQPGDAPAKSAAEVAKASTDAKKKDQKKKDFAAQESAAQKASTPGRALVDNPVDKKAKPSDPVIRSGDKKKDFAAQEAEAQKLSTPGRALVDNPVNKNPKSAAPAKKNGETTQAR